MPSHPASSELRGSATEARAPRVAWSRSEAFGAWVRLDDATLIAVDGDLAARLGVPHGRAIGRATRPLEVHVAVTSRCPAPCKGCYLDARPDGQEPGFELLVERLRAARDAGASTIAFGGGEPLGRRDLARLAEEARALGLVPVMTTSGIGMTEARARELRAFAQVNVSHDGVGEGYAQVRGFDGGGHAERAIALLAGAGVAVGVNVVITRGSFPLIEATCARAAELGAVELQLLRYKPAGRAASSDYAERALSPEQVDVLWSTIERVVAERRLRVRIDCAMVPLLSGSLLAAAPDAARALEALGVFGCEAARHLGALRVDGEAAACSFFSLSPRSLLPRARADRTLPLDAAWDDDPALAELRAYHAAPPEPCRSCPLAAVCRGGCQIVSLHARGAFAPDPECPRVRAHAASAG